MCDSRALFLCIPLRLWPLSISVTLLTVKFSTLLLPSATGSLVLFPSDKGRSELGSRLDASIS